jgi:hypothetical protein
MSLKILKEGGSGNNFKGNCSISIDLAMNDMDRVRKF